MFWNFWHFYCGSICVEDFFKIRFQALLFRTPSGNRLCTIKNVRNIIGTISNCYVFWRPINLVKINRTERGSHVKILANLTRSHSLAMKSFFSKIYNFSPTILKKYSTAKVFHWGFLNFASTLFLSNTYRLLLANDLLTIYYPIF